MLPWSYLGVSQARVFVGVEVEEVALQDVSLTFLMNNVVYSPAPSRTQVPRGHALQGKHSFSGGHVSLSNDFDTTKRTRRRSHWRSGEAYMVDGG